MDGNKPKSHTNALIISAYLERRLAYNRRNNVSLDFLVRVSDAAFLKSETLLPGPDLLLSACRPCSPTRRRRSGAPCVLRPSPTCLQIGAILPSPNVASLRIRGVLPSPASRAASSPLQDT